MSDAPTDDAAVDAPVADDARPQGLSMRELQIELNILVNDAETPAPVSLLQDHDAGGPRGLVALRPAGAAPPVTTRRRIVHVVRPPSPPTILDLRFDTAGTMVGCITAVHVPPADATPEFVTSFRYYDTARIPFSVYFRAAALNRVPPLFWAAHWEGSMAYEAANQRTRWLCKKWVARWLARKARAPPTNDVDVAGMSEVADIAPRDAVRFFDVTGRCSYVMHVRTAVHIVRMALEKNDEMFPIPHAPRNPFTNQPMTLAQLTVVFDQITRRYPRLPTTLHLFRACGLDVGVLDRRHNAYLRWCAVDTGLKDPDFRRGALCSAWETMYHKTFAASHPLLVHEFPRLFTEPSMQAARAVLEPIAREWMEMTMCAGVVRNPRHPSPDSIIAAFSEAMRIHLIIPTYAERPSLRSLPGVLTAQEAVSRVVEQLRGVTVTNVAPLVAPPVHAQGPRNDRRAIAVQNPFLGPSDAVHGLQSDASLLRSWQPPAAGASLRSLPSTAAAPTLRDPLFAAALEEASNADRASRSMVLSGAARRGDGAQRQPVGANGARGAHYNNMFMIRRNTPDMPHIGQAITVSGTAHLVEDAATAALESAYVQLDTMFSRAEADLEQATRHTTDVDDDDDDDDDVTVAEQPEAPSLQELANTVLRLLDGAPNESHDADGDVEMGENTHED